MFYQNTKESFQILSPKLTFKAEKTLKVPFCDYILASPSSTNFHIACVTNHAETGERIIPGYIRVYEEANFKQPYFEYEFVEAHDFKITWSPDGIF